MKRASYLSPLLIAALGLPLTACQEDQQGMDLLEEPEVYADYCREVVETGADRIERMQTFDAEERVVEHTEHKNGALVRKLIHTYDGASVETMELGADLSMVAMNASVFRDDGRPLRMEALVETADGIAPNIESWSYDDIGALNRFERDHDGNGVADYIETHGVRVAPPFVGLRFKSIDYTGGGVFSHRITFDDADQIVMEERDWDFNGSFEDDFDQTTINTYEDGLLVKRESAFVGPGVVSRETWTYEGDVVKEYEHVDPSIDVLLSTAKFSGNDYVRVTTVYGADQQTTSQNIEIFNAELEPLVSQQDLDGDGQLDEVITWTYDDRGRLVNRSEDQTGNGISDYVATWKYDNFDQILLATEDVDGDGTLDSVDEYAFADLSQPTLERHDNNGDGVWEESKVWDYDSVGNLLSMRGEVLGDTATTTQTATYSYDCWKK